jgi:hypothetical protein
MTTTRTNSGHDVDGVVPTPPQPPLTSTAEKKKEKEKKNSIQGV